MALLPDPDPLGLSHPPLWDFWRKDLWTRVLDGADINSFFAWPCIYHTMLQRHLAGVVARKLEVLQAAPDWARWREAIEMPHVGQPPDFLAGTSYSESLIFQAYHLLQWETTTGQRLADLRTICEFGAGYGALALVARRAGFTGDYYIQDVPEFGLLQQWFLSQMDVDAEWVTPKDDAPTAPLDLVIGMFSLSEVAPAERAAFLAVRPARSYLTLWSARWTTWDNAAWFAGWRAERPDLTWREWHNDLMLDDNRYLVGWTPAQSAPPTKRPRAPRGGK